MAKFDYNYEVCVCNKVTLGEILCAINENNANTVQMIKDITDAGNACGSCISSSHDFREPKLLLYIEDILKRELSDIHKELLFSYFKAQDWKKTANGPFEKFVPFPLRKKIYERLKSIADKKGVYIKICQCKAIFFMYCTNKFLLKA